MLKPNEVHFVGQVTQKALIYNGEKILLVQYPEKGGVGHPKEAWGKWDLPGGRLNQGEDAGEGVRREVREEIGVDIRIAGVLAAGTFTNLWGKEMFFVIYKAFLVVDENKPFMLEEAEIGDARWIEKKDFFTMPLLYEKYKEALKSILV